MMPGSGNTSYSIFVLHVSVVVLFVYADCVLPSTPTTYIPGASQEAVTNLIIPTITDNSTTQ
jgi:hypothetical protein